MINSDKIIESICEKIKFVAGDEFLLEEQFEEQLAEIKRNFIEAKETFLNNHKSKILTPYLTNYEFKDDETTEKANRSFKQFYKKTNSLLENKLWVWDTCYPLWFRELLISDTSARNQFLVKYKNVLATIKNSQKGLNSEELNRVKNYYINIYQREIKNSENSISSLSNTVPFDKHNKNSFYIIIYLISNDRIIKLCAGSSSITSEEHIIVKDLKKVTNTNSEVEFHYHGLHNPDCLAMDTYDEAVKLRILMSELRENRRNIR
jgi:hypothetical protein